MTVEQLRSMHQARPFVPFDLRMADGRAVPVNHPEVLAIIPPGGNIVVGFDDGTHEVIDLFLVLSLKQRNGTPRRGRGRS